MTKQKTQETEAQRTERFLRSTFLPKERPRLSKFERELFEMDSRIRVFDIAFELGEGKGEGAGFIPRKDMLCIAIGLPSSDHEIAHTVEMTNPKRWVLNDWGINIHEPKTRDGFFAAFSRETRVRAIQRHMTPNIPRIGALNNVHYWEPEAKKHLPFGRFKTYEQLRDWAVAIHDKTYAAWSLDRIRHEWEIRLNYIRNWMETKAAA